jgi:hypothetical protein
MNPNVLNLLRRFPALARAFVDRIPPERWASMARGARAKAHRVLKEADKLHEVAYRAKGNERRRLLRQARRARRWGGALESWAGVLEGRANG